MYLSILWICLYIYVIYDAMMNTLCVWRARNDCSNIKPNSCPMNGLRLIGLEWTLAMNKLCALGPGDHFVAPKRSSVG